MWGRGCGRVLLALSRGPLKREGRRGIKMSTQKNLLIYLQLTRM
jgi:hypothetical protein